MVKIADNSRNYFSKYSQYFYVWFSGNNLIILIKILGYDGYHQAIIIRLMIRVKICKSFLEEFLFPSFMVFSYFVAVSILLSFFLLNSWCFSQTRMMKKKIHHDQQTLKESETQMTACVM